jgi:hypothetical protein
MSMRNGTVGVAGDPGMVCIGGPCLQQNAYVQKGKKDGNREREKEREKRGKKEITREREGEGERERG